MEILNPLQVLGTRSVSSLQSLSKTIYFLFSSPEIFNGQKSVFPCLGEAMLPTWVDTSLKSMPMSAQK